MRLVTFRTNGSAPEAGILSNNQVTGLGMDMLTFLASGRTPEATGHTYGLDEVALLAPVPRPPKFICVGLNYHDHAVETKQQIPKVPTIFNKFTNVVIGPGASIVLPKASQQPDYEAEMGFVIGKDGRNIPASEA